jgi:hypothetical protein
LLLSFEVRSTTSNHESGALAIGLPKQSCKIRKGELVIYNLINNEIAEEVNPAQQNRLESDIN